MKFNLKVYILLFLIISSYTFEVSSMLKTHRIRNRRLTHKRSQSKSRIVTKDNFKAFFRGFIFGAISQLIVSELKNGEDKQKLENHLVEIIEKVIEDCGPEALNEYDYSIAGFKKEKGFDEEIFSDVFSQTERDQLLDVCIKKKAITELDVNEFSVKNILLNSLTSLFSKDKKFEEEYEKFKKEREDTNKQVEDLTNKYKTDLAKRKDTVKLDKTKKFIENASASLDRSIFSRNICEIMDQFINVDIIHHVIAMIKAGIKILQCSVKTFATYFPTKILSNITGQLLTAFGVSTGKTFLAGAFPPLIIAFIVKFIYSHFPELTKIFKFMISENKNEDRDLFENIGKITGEEVISLIKSRRIKKFRKFK